MPNHCRRWVASYFGAKVVPETVLTRGGSLFFYLVTMRRIRLTLMWRWVTEVDALQAALLWFNALLTSADSLDKISITKLTKECQF